MLILQHTDCDSADVYNDIGCTGKNLVILIQIRLTEERVGLIVLINNSESSTGDIPYSALICCSIKELLC